MSHGLNSRIQSWGAGRLSSFAGGRMLYGDLLLMLPGPRRTHSCDVGRKAAAKAHFGARRAQGRLGGGGVSA